MGFITIYAGHLIGILEEIAKMPGRDLDDVMHCKMIHGGSVHRSTTRTLDDKYRANLIWGQMSTNAQVCNIVHIN